jgi:hypothetical protein
MAVEILYFRGCPHWESARRLVERVAGDVGVEPELRLIEVPDAETAVALRFLGSPTIRVEGRDVEPGADDRDAFVLACRIYRLDSSASGLPAEAWIRDALTPDS